MEVWARSEVVASSDLIRVEGTAALAMACRMGRIDQAALNNHVSRLETLTGDLTLLSVSPAILTAAGRLSIDHGLRGYDAVHLASALALASENTAMVSGDGPLLEAALQRGLTVINPNRAT